jgi:hypothetical protein
LAFAVILTSVLAQAASSMMKTEYAQTSQSPAFVAGTGSWMVNGRTRRR